MTKQEFFAMLDEAFKGSTLEEMAENLSRMQNEWVKEYRKKFKDMVECDNCGCFVKLKDCTTQDREKSEVDHFRDTYYRSNKLIRYWICPKCGKPVYDYVIKILSSEALPD